MIFFKKPIWKATTRLFNEVWLSLNSFLCPVWAGMHFKFALVCASRTTQPNYINTSG